MNQEIKKRPSYKAVGVLFLIIVMPILWIMFNKTGVHYSKKLPIYFERELSANGDTIYHTIDDFKLQNQLGDSVSLESYKDKIILVNFFFANCETVCPKMNEFLSVHIYREFQKDPDIQFISFSVDPENDSPKVLLAYAAKFNAQFPNWQFLTGSKKQDLRPGIEQF